jgi:hypothetical protein
MNNVDNFEKLDKRVWILVERALDSCDSISTETDELISILTDIKSEVYGHESQQLLHASIKRTAVRLHELVKLKLDIFEDFCLISKFFNGRAA